MSITVTLPTEGRILTREQHALIERLAGKASRKQSIPRISASAGDPSASSSSPSGAASGKVKEVGEVTGTSNGTDSTGGGSSSGSGTTSQKTPAETRNKTSSNSWTTLKLFIASLVLGAGSLTTRFTPAFGDGTGKSWAIFGFDTGTTLFSALTASSALAPISEAGNHQNLN